MFHEPVLDFIYSAHKIETTHSDGSKTKTGQATGFIVDFGGQHNFVVTNRHAIDLDYKQLTPKYKDFKLTGLNIVGRRPDDVEYIMELEESSQYFFHSDYNNDVVLIRAIVKNVEQEPYGWSFSMDRVADEEVFKQINPFDLVCYSGFPKTHDKLGNRPILRSGHIASDPKFNYSWDGLDKGKCVAYEGFSTEGASGSPIFAPSRGMHGIPNSRNGYLIGVNAGHVMGEIGHSGISFFYKSTVIHEIIRENNLLG